LPVDYNKQYFTKVDVKVKAKAKVKMDNTWPSNFQLPTFKLPSDGNFETINSHNFARRLITVNKQIKMKIAIIGTGGVGGYFGGKLAQAGLDVTFLARNQHARAMLNNGLSVKSINGDFHVGQVKVKETIPEIGPSDLILVCVKAWQIKDIRDELRAIVHDSTVVIPLQNGILAFDELAEVIAPKNILQGLCRIISKIDGPGQINHFGVNPIIIFGEKDKTATPRLKAIKELFDKAGFNSQISTDMDAELWKKFIAICVSGLIAVANSTYGQLREIPKTRQMMLELLNEIYVLSQKMNINIEPDFVDKTVSFIDSFPYDSTSSLTRDVWEKKPSEIYYQNGTAVELGEKYGVPTPVNRFVFSCILPGEMKVRGERVK
jgi:2-dehydropantoate 2-reductase